MKADALSTDSPDSEVRAGDLNLPPHDLDAEEALLGAMLRNPGAIAVARENVDADDFYRLAHGTIFGVILTTHDCDQAVDSITLTAELRLRGLLEEVGGKDFIHTLPDLCPVAAHVRRYAAIVHEAAWRRRGMVLSQRLLEAFAVGGCPEQEATFGELQSLLHATSCGSSCRATCLGAGPSCTCKTSSASLPLTESG